MTVRPLVIVVLVVVGLMLASVAMLYAYRSQAPAAKEISYAHAVAQVEQGAVQRVTISGERGRLTLRDGQALGTTVPERDEGLARAVSEWNRANPSRTTELRYEHEVPTLGIAASVFLSLLPVALIGVLMIMLVVSAVKAVGARAADRYEALSRIADLRDRGVLSEDEFQREKRKIIG
jgi:ATP-dependent Zn protease